VPTFLLCGHYTRKYGDTTPSNDEEAIAEEGFSIGHEHYLRLLLRHILVVSTALWPRAHSEGLRQVHLGTRKLCAQPGSAEVVLLETTEHLEIRYLDRALSC
jgi:hypothetical protein